MKKLSLLSLLLTFSCAGVQTTSTSFAAHAESFVIFGYEIPGEDITAAEALVPQGATIVTMTSTPDDWTSIMGVINNIMGIQRTSISGTL
jgi:hypothetical protein